LLAQGLEKHPHFIDLREQATLNAIVLPVVLKLIWRTFRVKKHSGKVTNKGLVSTVYDQKLGLHLCRIIAQFRLAKLSQIAAKPPVLWA